MPRTQLNESEKAQGFLEKYSVERPGMDMSFAEP